MVKAHTLNLYYQECATGNIRTLIFIIMNVPIFCWKSPVDLALEGFLLLIILANLNIANGKENSTSIECEEANVKHWHWNYWDKVNDTVTRCNVQCSPKCTCTLDDAEVTRHCTSGNVTISPVIYPSNNISYLKWDYSVLHDIKPGAFLRIGDTLVFLHLTNVNLQHLQPGVFTGLTGLTHLELSRNNLSEFEVEVFTGLIWLRELYLFENRLSRIAEGAFEDLVQLKQLKLDRNRLLKISAGVFRGLIQLEVLLLWDNRIYETATGAFEDLQQLQDLYLSGNMLLEIKVGTFRELTNLEVLALQNNKLNRIAKCAFENLVELQKLWLDDNTLLELQVGLFQNLIHLRELDLSNNKLEALPRDIFRNLQRLVVLRLSFNNLHRIPAKLFYYCTHIRVLVLQGNPLLWIEKDALANLHENATLAVTDFATCCFTSAQCDSSPPLLPYLTCKRLLPYDLLRIAIWLVCAFAIFGNIFALCTRLMNKRQRNKVQFLLIMNLSISDFVMGIYLAVLLSADLYYTEYFPSHSESWRHSMLCRTAGALSVLSSEASAFFITLITIDRFFGIKYTYSKFRLVANLPA